MMNDENHNTLSADETPYGAPGLPSAIKFNIPTDVLTPAQRTAEVYLRDLTQMAAGAQYETRAENLRNHHQKVEDKLGRNPFSDAAKDPKYTEWMYRASEASQRDPELAAAWQAVLEAIVNSDTDRGTLLKMVQTLEPREARFLANLSEDTRRRYSIFYLTSHLLRGFPDHSIMQSLRQKGILLKPFDAILYNKRPTSIMLWFVGAAISATAISTDFFGIMSGYSGIFYVIIRLYIAMSISMVVFYAFIRLLMPSLTNEGSHLVRSMNEYIART